MKSFHCSEQLKSELVAKALEHEHLDNVIRGRYWDGEKGCSVGCILQDPNSGYEQYPEKFGIPTWLAHLQDGLFEGMSLDKSETWTSEFFQAIPVGVDVDDAKKPFLLAILDICLQILDTLEPGHVPDYVVLAVKQSMLAIESGEGLEEAAAAGWAAAAQAAVRSAGWAAAASAAAYDHFADQLLDILKSLR